MSTFGDAVKGIREILLLQRDVRDLEEAVSSQRVELEHMSDQIIDLDKRLFAIERIMEFSARTPRQTRIEEQ
jgi:cell division protein FtsL